MNVFFLYLAYVLNVYHIKYSLLLEMIYMYCDQFDFRKEHSIEVLSKLIGIRALTNIIALEYFRYVTNLPPVVEDTGFETRLFCANIHWSFILKNMPYVYISF